MFSSFFPHPAVSAKEKALAEVPEVLDNAAFQQPVLGLSGRRLDRFFAGSHIFKVDWNVATDVPQPFDGLGPLFSRSSCLACHANNGRGHPPTPTENLFSIVVRLQVSGASRRLHQVYGAQLDYQAIQGVEVEGRARISYETVHGRFTDGNPYDLQRPLYSFVDLNFGPLSRDTLISPRLPPAVFGLGFLEAVDESDILIAADPADRNHDGISGRPSWVKTASGTRLLGRFGWKAESPTLRHQVASALSRDIGITSSLFPDSTCTPPEAACRQAGSGWAPEISDELLSDLVLYLQLLAPPPARQQQDTSVLRGQLVFNRAGCGACHRRLLRTGRGAEHLELAKQVIHPYTDLLLHDMGEGLADGMAGYPRSREWRTPPLWGIGLSERVNNNASLLHDGRARNVLEAILWHGGEADRAQQFVLRLSAPDRDALVSFLNSL